MRVNLPIGGGFGVALFLAGLGVPMVGGSAGLGWTLTVLSVVILLGCAILAFMGRKDPHPVAAAVADQFAKWPQPLSDLDRHLSADRAEALREVSKLLIREMPLLMNYEDGLRETERLRELCQTIGHTSDSLVLVRGFQNHYMDWRFASSVDCGIDVAAHQWRHQSVLHHNQAVQALGAGLHSWLRGEDMAVAMDHVRQKLEMVRERWPIPSIAFNATPTEPGFKLTVQEGLPALVPAKDASDGK